jgi:pyruvate,water dikinase
METTMSTYVLPLDSSEATLERVGGKGANLSELARAGFAVPPGYLVTTEAYRAFVRANRIGERIVGLARGVAPNDPVALDQVSEQIGALFEQGQMPDEIATAIVEAYQALAASPHPPAPSPTLGGRGVEAGSLLQRGAETPPLPMWERGAGGEGEETALPVAVRSSATAEDLPGLSFAGQQDTYLNIVGQSALLDAVRRCWASLWTARAIGYRARNGIAPDDVALAVVVQQLIPSEVSGVLFTANPLTGRRDEIVIDASFGLGEAIVSGQVEPDHYVVDPNGWRITGRKIGAKALAIVPRAGGGTDHVARAEGQQALEDGAILELARTAHHVAEHYGAPQDIEWAWAGGRLYLLQSRPITSLYPIPEPRGGDRRRTTDDGRPMADANDHRLSSIVDRQTPRIYWSFGSVQGVLDPFTPLGRDMIRLLARSVFQLFHIRRVTPQDALVDAGGRLFIDITDATSVFAFVLANTDPAAAQTLRRLVAEGRVAMKNPFDRTKMRALRPTLIRVLGRVLATLQAPAFQRARAAALAEEYIAGAGERAAKAQTLDQLLTTMERDLSQFVAEVMPHVIPVVALGIGSMKIVDRWLVEWLGMRPGAVFQLMRGLPGNVTSEMDLRLWSEVQAIRADADARAFMLTQPLEGIVEAYERGELPPVAQHAVERFMARYGMRGMGEIDFGRARWRDDPTPILQTIHNYLQQDNPDLAPDVVFARGAAEADRLADAWVAQARGTRFGAVRARLLRLAIDRMRALAGFRESPKFFVIQQFGIYHAALLGFGRELARQGTLERAEDVFFIPLDTLRRFARGETVDLRVIAADERAAYAREQARPRMPRLILSSGETFYDGLSEEGSADLVGDPVSPGVVEGVARVVLDPRGVRLRPGEILVCPATDPGWTPLFLTAGGLVMEIGGMVTHGSVVAREYGIPAVVGVHDATTRIQTGQRVRVDGTQGRITILEQVSDSPATAEHRSN